MEYTNASVKEELINFISYETEIIMIPNESTEKLRNRIEQAIADHKLTRAEMDSIMHIAMEDGHIDSQEQALLTQLQDMIENKMVKIVP